MAGIPGLAFVANIGWRALAGKAVANAAGDVKAAGKWIGSLDLVHVLLLVTCIALAVDHIALIISHRHSAKVDGQLTAANNALVASRANEQTLKVAFKKQNAAVADLGSKSAGQQKIAAKAENLAAQRANEAQATSERLRQSSRSAPLKSASLCEPSTALKDQWK